MKLFINGIIIGIAKVIPGLSGSVLAISLGIYEQTLKKILNPIKNFKYLLILFSSILLGIVLSSKILLFFFLKYQSILTYLFILLILFNLKDIIKEIKPTHKNILILILSILIFILLSTITSINISNKFLLYFISGLFEGFGTIIPALSSTSLLISINMYDYYLLSISNIFNMNYILSNISFYLLFILGLFISSASSIIILNYILKKYKQETYTVILSIIILNIISIIF